MASLATVVTPAPSPSPSPTATAEPSPSSTPAPTVTVTQTVTAQPTGPQTVTLDGDQFGGLTTGLVLLLCLVAALLMSQMRRP
ncbi:hypothetical protein QFZ57_004333 [Arthrobacter sp. B1I2]|nr:hypothetical protein [Arthrobacter sp. B1I2]